MSLGRVPHACITADLRTAASGRRTPGPVPGPAEGCIRILHAQVCAGDRSVRGLTEALIRVSGIYASSEEYFREYTITGPVLEEAPAPATILISRDDPAIPADDFFGLRLAPHGKLIIHDYGGHNGFLSNLLGAAWYEEKMLELFQTKEP
ncbi:MAG: hypothetical protein ACOX2W_13460 [Desulfomonilia bacterium]